MCDSGDAQLHPVRENVLRMNWNLLAIAVVLVAGAAYLGLRPVYEEFRRKREAQRKKPERYRVT
jgi:hypothetical protein